MLDWKLQELDNEGQRTKLRTDGPMGNSECI